MSSNIPYSAILDPQSVWEVSTTDGCGGLYKLGIYQGLVPVIALALAGKADDYLRFKLVQPQIVPMDADPDLMATLFRIDGVPNAAAVEALDRINLPVRMKPSAGDDELIHITAGRDMKEQTEIEERLLIKRAVKKLSPTEIEAIVKRVKDGGLLQ